MIKKLKFMSAFLSAVMLMSLPCTELPAHAHAVRKIVIIGDSVSTRSGLHDGELSWPEIIQDYAMCQIQNFSDAGNTTADILTSLDTPEIQTALAQADMIFISAGMQDIMDEFLFTSRNFMTAFGFETFPDVFTANLAEHGFSSEDELIPYATQLNTLLRLHKNDIARNIQKINEKLSACSDAEIIWQTCYNLLDNVEFYPDLSPKRQTSYQSMIDTADSVLNESLNLYLRQFADQNRHYLADVYADFHGNAWQYTNLYQLNPEPNALGHARIAESLISTAHLSRMGDIDGDDLIQASDAAVILQHSANTGSGMAGILDDAQSFAADVDENDEITSQDAAQILTYAACQGAGRCYQFYKADAIEPELIDPEPEFPDSGLADPDPTQPEELADPDPEFPDSGLADPDPTAPAFW